MVRKTVYKGLCVGGPMDGREAISRFPKGFLLVDKPNDTCWIYDWKLQDPVASVFVVRDAKGTPVDYERRILTAEEPDYDVLALP